MNQHYSTFSIACTSCGEPSNAYGSKGGKDPVREIPDQPQEPEILPDLPPEPEPDLFPEIPDNPIPEISPGGHEPEISPSPEF
jgi:hypothetical protein